MRKTRCFCKICSVAGHIGSTCYDQRFCIGLNQLIPVIILQPSALIHTRKTELQALFPQPVERPQNRVMLTYRCDDMIARCKKTTQCNVQGLRCICRKGNTGRVWCVEELCHCAPCSINKTACVQRWLMGTPSRIACRAHCVQHSLLYLRRLAQGRGSVIQIDHGFTTLPACVSFSTMVYMLVTLPTASFSVRP